VLDEATSALDSESEQLIQSALWELMKGRTAIVIAHRLSTIQKMDRILVLENGTITEQGTHSELVKKQGTYAQLWAHQSGGFLEE
jgi:ATP-binding cassette subfamily B protein